MARKYICIACILLGIFIPVFLVAQEWSVSQKEVLKVVESGWDSLARKDIDEFLNNFHPEFKGFVNWRDIPIDKEILREAIIKRDQTSKIVSYKIDPFTVKFYGDVAFVQYRCEVREIEANTEESHSFFKYTDILVKNKGKWLIAGTHKEKVR